MVLPWPRQNRRPDIRIGHFRGPQYLIIISSPISRVGSFKMSYKTIPILNEARLNTYF